MEGNPLVEFLTRSRYFIFAVLLHFIIALMISSVVLIEAFRAPEDFDVGYVAGDGGGGGTPPPPASQTAPPQEDQSLSVPTQQATTAPMEIIANAGPPVTGAPSIPVPSIVGSSFELGVEQIIPRNMQQAQSGITGRISNVRSFVNSWRPNSRPGTPGRQIKAEFSAYIAKYADGDWQSALNIDRKTGEIRQSPVTNLLMISQIWTRDRIKANVKPKPLDLSSEEIFEVKPPFIFFTGHKSFKLNAEEVKNLRKYLLYGGCLWGDNGLAGRGSRFDVSFRQEMKRVLPDDNLQFQVLPNGHPIYTQDTYYNMPDGPPSGMNYFQEPTECIKLDGFIAVIYTPNNYTDMWRLGLNLDAAARGRVEPELAMTSRVVNRIPRHMWADKEIYYRNFEPEAAAQCYQFGLNIIIHLLIRFDEVLNSNIG